MSCVILKQILFRRQGSTLLATSPDYLVQRKYKVFVCMCVCVCVEKTENVKLIGQLVPISTIPAYAYE